MILKNIYLFLGGGWGWGGVYCCFFSTSLSLAGNSGRLTWAVRPCVFEVLFV